MIDEDRACAQLVHEAELHPTKGRPLTRTAGSDYLRGCGEGILLVEDDDAVRDVMAKMLLRGGYAVFCASSATEALSVFAKERAQIHLVLSDVGLPDCADLGLVCQLLSQNSGLQILMTSGCSEDGWRWPVMREKGFRFIQKPYGCGELLEAVREAIGLS